MSKISSIISSQKTQPARPDMSPREQRAKRHSYATDSGVHGGVMRSEKTSDVERHHASPPYSPEPHTSPILPAVPDVSAPRDERSPQVASPPPPPSPQHVATS